MIKLTTAEVMQKSIEKARAVKPFVRVVSFGSPFTKLHITRMFGC